MVAGNHVFHEQCSYLAGAQLMTATNRQWMLLRIECAPSKTQFRITGRAASPEFAASMVELVTKQLLGA